MPSRAPSSCPAENASESEWLSHVLAEDKAAFGTTEADSQASADKSHARGVKIGYLVDWTIRHDCWEWPTWKVVRDIVKPATKKTRCRYADLLAKEGVIGPAKSFGSHCWGAKWGLLIAALADEADTERTVWVDIFAVRQWPGNAADLCFDKVVRKCTSFVIACQEFQTRKDNGITVLGNLTSQQAQARQVHLLPKEVRQSIAFLRIWCLAEVMAAVDVDMAVIMKTGKMVSDSDKKGGIGFLGSHSMSHAVVNIIDVSQAEAAVDEDRKRILNQARNKPGGLDRINARVQSAVYASMVCYDLPKVQAAACGDASLDLNRATQAKIDEWGMAAAGGGYLALLKRTLDKGARAGVIVPGGVTAMSSAAFNNQPKSVKMLLDRAPDAKTAAVEPDEDGDTAISMAARGGATEIVQMLYDHGADVNYPNKVGNSPLMRAAMASGDVGFESAKLLLQLKASVDQQSENKRTALHFAAKASNRKIVELLCEHGASTSIESNFGNAYKYADQCVYAREVREIMDRY